MQYFNGFLVRSEVARIFLKFVKIRRDGRPRYHIVREHPVPNAQTYVMPARHPYYEEILWIINKVHESGLYYLWRKDDFGWAMHAPRYMKKIKDTPLTGNKYVPLSTEHLQSAFVLLLFGEALALVMFIVEFIYKMINKK
ncbi:Ionotropic receptor 68b [Carabus blaptoides fortunei]